jgi:hypothetical protein
VRTGARYLLLTDVSRFYHSIYTHSIPWALHTKQVAKHNRGPGLLGNRLDKLLRNAQDGQTIGIPVGPDTSLLMAELLLGAVDAIVAREMRKIRGVRYIDDYELAFGSLSEAENAVNELQDALTDYELALNGMKTRIVELPYPLDPVWALELSTYRLRTGRGAQGTDLINFFSRAFELSKERPTDSVLNFAIARLRSLTVDAGNWPLLQSLLLQCATGELGTLRFVQPEIDRYVQAGRTLARRTFIDVINAHIERHSRAGYSSEVAWGLWCLIAFGLPLDRRVATRVSALEDSIVALLALDARARGLVPRGGLDTTLWESHMTGAGLFGEQWLLAYEANVKGWLPSVGGGDHVTADAGFGHLKQHGVYFYDVAAQIAPPVPAAGPLPYIALP